MKVRDVGQAMMDLPRPAATEERKGSQDAPKEFRRQMNELGSAEYEKHLRDLRERIQMQGVVVASKVDLKELEKYRRLVSELLNETTSNAYAYLKMDKFDARGRHKTFAIIKKVNQKLDEMAAEVLREQADNIRLMRMADDIRGLLVDLFM